jgi:hypothetical protein
MFDTFRVVEYSLVTQTSKRRAGQDALLYTEDEVAFTRFAILQEGVGDEVACWRLFRVGRERPRDDAVYAEIEGELYAFWKEMDAPFPSKDRVVLLLREMVHADRQSAACLAKEENEADHPFLC